VFDGHLPELLILLVVAVIILGPKRLPDAGKSLGRAIRGFREETSGLKEDFSSMKSEAQGFHGEMVGVKDTVKSSVTDAVNVNGASAQTVVPAEPRV
jgi:TatA/E family protein of Tat protein translocase